MGQRVLESEFQLGKQLCLVNELGFFQVLQPKSKSLDGLIGDGFQYLA